MKRSSYTNIKSALLGLCLMSVYPVVSSAVSIEIADFDAGSAFINFDELADGTPVTNQYSGLGLTVSGSLGNDGTGSASTVTAVISGGAYSAPTYIGQPDNNWDGSIIFDFSGVFLDQFGLISVDSLGSWLSVYDSSNVLIETVFGSGAVLDFIGIDTGGIGISRAIVSGDFYAVDDVRFNGRPASVPEPSTLALFSLGLLGFAFASRRGRIN